MEDRLTAQLRAALSQSEYIALLEHFAGCRLYVSANPKLSGLLANAIGLDGAKKLEKVFGAVSIRVPLGRESRIRHYISKGLSAPLIAVRLGMTENGVYKAISRYGVTLAKNKAGWRRPGVPPVAPDIKGQLAELSERSSRTS